MHSPRMLSALALVAGCSIGNHKSQVVRQNPVPDDVRAALQALPQAQVVAVHESGIPRFLVGRLNAQPLTGMSAAEMTPALAGLAPVFRLEPQNLRVASARVDELGKSHIWIKQQKNGLPVVNGDLRLHVDGSGTIYSVSGSAYDGVTDIDTTAAVAADRAVAKAVAQYPAGTVSPIGTPRLLYIIAGEHGEMHLAWEIAVRGRPAVDDKVYVDAKAANAEVVDVHPVSEPALSRTVFDLHASVNLADATLLRDEGDPPVAAADSAFADDANAAFDNTGKAFDCYKQVFKRDSFDGEGHPLFSFVDAPFSNNAAFFSVDDPANPDLKGFMVFGRGDGVLFTQNMAADQDITDHELAHGITFTTSGLVPHFESGALNESFSDAMAATCDAFRRNTVDANTFKIGEQSFTPAVAGDAIRVMNDPARQGDPDFYADRFLGTADNGGVHTNAGIPNLAFALEVAGGRHPRGRSRTFVNALGIQRTSKILFRANTEFLTPDAKMIDERAAELLAAQELFGPFAAFQTFKAWNAVGVPIALFDFSDDFDEIEQVDAPDSFIISLDRTKTQVFQIDVPDGASKLTFQTRGGTGGGGPGDTTGHLAILGKAGAPPSVTTAFDGSVTAADFDEVAFSDQFSTNETLQIDNPPPGPFFVMVFAAQDFLNVSAFVDVY
jgi:bacillolysin